MVSSEFSQSIKFDLSPQISHAHFSDAFFSNKLCFFLAIKEPRVLARGALSLTSIKKHNIKEATNQEYTELSAKKHESLFVLVGRRSRSHEEFSARSSLCWKNHHLNESWRPGQRLTYQCGTRGRARSRSCLTNYAPINSSHMES